MKKTLLTGIIGSIFLGVGSIMTINENETVSVVGGADGPTSVYIAGKLNPDFAILLLTIGSLLLIIALIMYLKKGHKWKRVLSIVVPFAIIVGGISYNSYIRIHTIKLSGNERVKSEQIQPTFGKVKVNSTVDTNVIFTDIETEETYEIGYITSGVSESIQLESGKWYKVEGNGDLTIRPVNVRISDFSGCENEKGQAYFNAKVLETNKGSIDVRCIEAFNSGISVDEELSVTKDVVSAKGIPELNIGDNIRVVFDGDVMECDPLQIGTVYAIYLLDENGEVISNDE